MLGNLSIGILQRSPEGFQFECGNCKSLSELGRLEIPAALDLKQAAELHSCPRCGVRSKNSIIAEAISR